MTYPLATLAPTISATGIAAPSYQDIFLSLQASFQLIYGSDIYISPDSQDGQWLAIIAQAIFDANNAAIAVYQSFSPTYSQGAGLSSMVKINGLSRNISGYSTAVGTVSGTAGAVITGGVVQDINNNLWNLPSPITIPSSGSITETVTSQEPGAILAPAGTINTIYNPQYGWGSFTNTADAVIGAAVETDAALQARQAKSVALPAQTVMSSILAAILALPAVDYATGYSNDTAVTDANGVPAHSITIVVWSATAIPVNDVANVIYLYKMPGAQTYAAGTGAQAVTIYSPQGYPTVINFNLLQKVYIYFDITIVKLANFVTGTETDIATAIGNFLNSQEAGFDVYPSQIQAVAQSAAETFYIAAFKLGTTPSPTGTSPIMIAYTSYATVNYSTISVHV